jgi:spermidine synthase
MKKSIYEKFGECYQFHRIYDEIESFETPYQKVLYIKNSKDPDFGCLMIDKRIQFSLQDEFLYHEPLVHPAMFAHQNPKDILLIGGGDGMALRELIKHPINSITMIDLDEQFVEWCKKRPQWHNDSFSDPRINIIYQDATTEIKKINKKFDIIIIDLVDLNDHKIFKNDKKYYSTLYLYSEEFYQDCRNCLKDSQSIITIQSYDIIKLDDCYKKHKYALEQLKKVFKNCYSYYSYVESWGCANSFISCSDSVDVTKLTPNRINDIEAMQHLFKVYEPEFHYKLFYLNKVTRKLLEI